MKGQRTYKLNAELIDALRTERGLSWKKLAEKADVHGRVEDILKLAGLAASADRLVGELTAYRTTSSKNSGVHPKGVGCSAMSWVARMSQPRACRLRSITSRTA